MNTEKLESQPF